MPLEHNLRTIIEKRMEHALLLLCLEEYAKGAPQYLYKGDGVLHNMHREDEQKRALGAYI